MKTTKRISKQPTQIQKETQSESVPELERRPVQEKEESLDDVTESPFEALIELPPEEERAIQGLLTQRTRKAAAEFAGVSERKLYRLLKKTEFQEALREAKRAAYAHAVARLNHMAGSAVDTIEDMMNDPSLPPNIRLRAASNILQHTAQSVALETEARVEQLRLGRDVWDEVKDSNPKTFTS